MKVGAAYCGAPPDPTDLVGRFNLDPVLILALVALTLLHVAACRRSGRPAWPALLGWGVTAAAVLSPLCALSVSLFAARVGQHMLLLLVAAPLIATALPGRRTIGPWPPTAAFFVALWFWHMPAPYAATFASPAIYWAMHLSLFASGIWLWRALLRHDGEGSVSALAAGTVSSIQMGLLGALLALASRPLFSPHYLTTEAWGLTPLADQQLGGMLMWIPGCLLFLVVALRSFRTLWHSLETPQAA